MNGYTVQSHSAVNAIRCGRCQEHKSASDFRLPQSGKYCRPCEKEYKREHYLRNKDAIKAKSQSWRLANRSRYIANNKRYYAENRERLLRDSLEWQRRNKEAVNARKLAWRNANLEKTRAVEAAYRERNRILCNERIRAWKKEHPERLVIYTQLRGRGIRLATPAWANLEAMEELYQKASALRKSGHNVHVDHIVPLHNKLVCGLHWEGNLRIVPAEENLRKCNYHWPDMPSNPEFANPG